MNVDIQKLLEPKVFQYKELKDERSYHFIVVGAGGTGGYLLPNLARMVSIANKRMKAHGYDEHKITIIDADEV